MVAGHFTYNILCSSCVVSNAVFLIQLIWIWLYHVDEVCDDFFLFNGYRFEVFHYRLQNKQNNRWILLEVLLKDLF